MADTAALATKPVIEPLTKLKPLIHFAHANGVPSAVYQQLLTGLQDEFDIVLLPIIGINPQYPVTDGWANLVEEIAHSITSQAQGRPVIAMGHSLGGALSYMVAHKYPQLIKGLVMLDPPLIVGFPSFMLMLSKWLGMIDKVTPAGLSKTRRDHWDSKQQAADLLRPRGLFKRFTQSSFDHYIEYGLTDDTQNGGATLTIPKALEVAIFRGIPTSFWWSKRHAPKVPCHLIVGGKSEFHARGMSKLIHRQQKIPLTVLENGGHMFPLEIPEQAVLAVKSAILRMQLKT